MLQGAEIVNQTGGPKSISAKYQRPRPRERTGRENVEWKRIKSLDQSVLDANRIARDAASVIGRWLLFKHLTPLEAESARRYAYIMGRFDRYFTEGRRTAKSPSYERAYGEDQELERRAFDGSMQFYEKAAKQARKRYDKLQKILLHYADPVTRRNLMKEALDQMCCEDIEPPAQYRSDIAAALRHIGHEFGVTVQSRRGRPRKGRG
jgi:hypothetical protein